MERLKEEAWQERLRREASQAQLRAEALKGEMWWVSIGGSVLLVLGEREDDASVGSKSRWEGEVASGRSYHR